MGLIKEPEGVYFVVENKPLTDEEQKKISEFIRSYKITKKAKTKKKALPKTRKKIAA